MANGANAGTGEPSRSSSASPATRPPFRRRHLRRGLLALAAIIALPFLVRALLLGGVIRPIRIAGGSMAETLCGDHWSIRCPGCGFGYRCGADEAPRDELVCPNCGSVHPLASTASLVPGERVWIDRWPSVIGPSPRTLRRGNLVALVQPDAPREFATKRLVAFPGESVAIRDGDVWIDGAPWRKNWRELTALAVVVHDDRFRPTSPPNEPARWRPDGDAGDWCVEPAGYRCDPSDPTREEPQWLRFHPLVGHSLLAAPERDTPIRDLDPYNQNVSRTLNPVTDLLVQARVRIAAHAVLVVDLDDGRESLRLRLSAAEGLEVFEWNDEGERRLATFPAGRIGADREFPLGFAQCDRQVLVALDGREVVRVPLPEDAPFRTPATRPWSIGVSRGAVRLRDLRLLRDIHYLAPRYPRSISPRKLEVDEWFVLGDNPPISLDSRDWPAGSVRSSQLIGRVLFSSPAAE